MKNNGAASLAEFALVFSIFTLFFFAILEMGFVMWQVQQGAIASKRAVRIAATRDLIVPGAIEDCGIPTTATPGTLCADVPGSDSWGPVTCPGSAACGPDVARVIDEINAFYPKSADGTVLIELTGAGLGFVGLGKPVPIVTVRFEDVPFDFIVLGPIVGAFTMPTLSASAPAEDLTNGPGA